MFIYIMYQGELSQGQIQNDEWANFEQSQDSQCISFPSSPIIDYENTMKNIVFQLNLSQIRPQVLKHHRITITHNTSISTIFDVYEKDCYVSIKKRHHYGTHCIYDVVLANFTLQIHLLNLHRSSDDNDTALSENQIGKGGFGSVRVVKAGNNTLAIKRINFLKKAQGIDGFDIQTENAEYKQINKAIRQYCLYKICSMLKIGPQVIFQSNYDLVCFNNCIEFIMQLCDVPYKNRNFMKDKGLIIQKLEQDLMQNLKLLHSLSIVHKDIKPENILYSQSLQRFVFTDFGITHAVKESINEKTQTTFAGTPQYCSEQMKQLLNVGKGYVNLYLNDFEGLKKSISKFHQEQSKKSSLSFNAMSYNSISDKMSYGCNDDDEQMEAPASFQEWFENEAIQSSYKSSQNIYISSTHSLDAPMKHASLINFYQSLILYEIFMNQEKTKEITAVQISTRIERYKQEIDNHFVQDEINRYVMSIFYPSQHNSTLTLKIVDLKNTARNYGPKHEETLQKIDQILLEEFTTEMTDYYDYFKSLKESIIGDPQCFQISNFEKEMTIHIYLKNYNYFIGCCIRIMREAVRFKKRLKQANNDQQSSTKLNFVFLCKIYIICQKLNVLTISESNILNELFLRLWNEEEINDLREQIYEQMRIHNYNSHYAFTQNPASNRIVAKLIRHAINFMIKSQNISAFHILDAFNYFIYRFNWTNSEDYNFYNKFLEKLESIQTYNQGNIYQLKSEIVKTYRKICRLQNKTIDKKHYIERAKIITNYMKEIHDKRYYFTCKAQLIWIYCQNRQYQKLSLSTAFETLKQIQIDDSPEISKHYALIQINNVIAVLYLTKQLYSESLYHLKNVEKYIIKYYGCQNLMLSYYECLSNIALSYYKQKDLTNALLAYKKALKYLQDTKKVACYEKSFVYRSIIVIRLQMGIQKQDYPQIEALIKNIVYESIFTLVSLTVSEFQLKNYIIDRNIFNFTHTSSSIYVRIFIMKTLLKYLEDHLNYFIIPYDKINYELNRIYTKELKQPIKAYPYIWNYIKIKIKDFHDVKQEDFKLMNNFVQKLIKNNSSRRALIILKKYIFHIPLDMHEEREKTFKIFYKIHRSLNHPFERITFELIANDCQVLYNKNFSKIYKTQLNHNAKMINLLLKKWLSRI